MRLRFSESTIKLHSKKTRSTQLDLISLNEEFIKLGVNADSYIALGDSFKGTKDITIDNKTYKANEYYHISKNQYPYMVIHTTTYSPRQETFIGDYYFTWDTATDIYISQVEDNDALSGLYMIEAYINNKKIGYMLRSSEELYYSDEVLDKGESITIADNNTIGETIDHSQLLFVGGEEITAETITQKDGTMFLGGINIKRPQITGSYDFNDNPATVSKENAVQYIRQNIGISSTHRECCIPKTMVSEGYSWGNSLNACIYNPTTHTSEGSTNIAGFKYGEHYRLGLQFQYKTGKWSQPIFINDVDETQKPSLNPNDQNRSDVFIQSIPTFVASLWESAGKELINAGYKRVRGVVCFPKESDQLILCQGLLNPTVYSIAGYVNHAPDRQSSWFFRPIPKNKNDTGDGVAATVQWKHGLTLYSGDDDIDIQEYPHKPTRADEIQSTDVCFSNTESIVLDENDQKWKFIHEGIEVGDNNSTYSGYSDEDLSNVFVVDWKNLTFHSPEIEFNDAFHNLDTSTITCKITGKYNVASNIGDMNIITSTPTLATDTPGIYHRVIYTSISASRICAGLFYRDTIVGWDGTDFTANGVSWYGDEYNPSNRPTFMSYMVYPWHRTGSLNNDCVRPAGKGVRSAMLEQKKMINLMYFGSTDLHNRGYGEDVDTRIDLQPDDIKIFNSD